MTAVTIAGQTGLAGIRYRRTRPGPENDLVDRFLSGLRFGVPAGVRVTVFREPALLSGFPDLVAVKWDEGIANTWHADRAKLRDDDVRLLHFLATHGPANEADLEHFNFRRVRRVMAELIELGLVKELRGKWRSIPVRQAFAVRGIIAFEAKLSDWAGAVEQAALNRWFATESYVLVPLGAPRHSLVESARARGVGVWVEGELHPRLRAVRAASDRPVSYASWLFNEWAWRWSLVRNR